MAIQDARISSDDPAWVHVYGEPNDVERVIDRHAASAVLVAGYDVKNVFSAEHDGQPALRFTLAADNREIGRMVLRTDVPTEYTFEFDAEFDNEADARQFVDTVKNPPLAKAKVCQSIQDLAYDEVSLEEAIAQLSADFGISITVMDKSGPGGGWPQVKLIGLVPNVLKALQDAWNYDEDDAISVTEAVTA